MADTYTRQQYLDDCTSDDPAARRAAFERYFGQLVTERTIGVVVRSIGGPRLLACTDKTNLSDIPLREWDRLVPNLPGSGWFRGTGDYYTTANGVCLAKVAALQWIARQEGD